MSGEYRRAGAPQGPPSLEELADLHAGALDEQAAAELRRRVDADPEARETLAALDATSAELGDLPPLTMPADVSGRIEDALAQEVRNRTPQQPVAPHQQVPGQPAPAQQPATGGQVVDFAAAKRRRNQRWALGAGLAGVAAAAAAVVFAVLPGTGQQDQTALPGQQPGGNSAPANPPMALRGDQVQLNGEQFSQVMKSDQYLRSLNDPQRLISCLQANGVSGGKPMGAKEITLNGQRAQLLILPDGGIGKFRLLTVGPGCGQGNPATLSDSTFGGS
ncbi:hypothetical protein GCM10009854_07880 [Saccharopolyspora halophila]|uniref:Anti-sigma factor n=1 Tax=Saccharopolyspora halophila TaxID=405551 RepID=A0ABN3FP83_9PSEU